MDIIKVRKPSVHKQDNAWRGMCGYVIWASTETREPGIYVSHYSACHREDYRTSRQAWIELAEHMRTKHVTKP